MHCDVGNIRCGSDCRLLLAIGLAELILQPLPRKPYNTIIATQTNSVVKNEIAVQAGDRF